ncbi:MAG: DUF4372 domain-containing protein [Deltaproteobacteria bacterium]|jgi:hypothetical protein|nr:DUF4372 domain-containing protein [Deltaproteobacteria bacterium]
MAVSNSYRSKAADFRSPTSCFAQILKFIKMVDFVGIVRECGADRHLKGFSSWDHLVAMVYGMISGAFPCARSSTA